MTKALACLLLLTFVFTINSVQGQQAGPTLFTYDELVALYENDPPAADLSNKLAKLLTTPFVNNSVRTRPATAKSLRVATWNIERGIEFEALKAALTNHQRFFRRLAPAMRGSG